MNSKALLFLAALSTGLIFIGAFLKIIDITETGRIMISAGFVGFALFLLGFFKKVMSFSK